MYPMLAQCLSRKPGDRLVRRKFHGMSVWTECCYDHVSFLGHMDFLGNSHCHLLLLTRPCVGGEGTVRENVEIFSLDKRVEGETTDQDGEHGKREWKLRAGTESEPSSVARTDWQQRSQAC